MQSPTHSVLRSLLALVALCFAPSIVRAQAIPAAGTFGALVEPPRVSAYGYDANRKGKFLVSLCHGGDGTFWVGTEDMGIWRCDPRAAKDKQWTQFTTKNGLGDDNAYALALDKRGRIWAGHLNTGVSVFDGVRWQNYPTHAGPLGERVFDIAVSPIDGDVWIAHSAGLTRYRNQSDTWTHITRFDGLPSVALIALDFDLNGSLFVGTACDGVAISHSDSDWTRWTTAKPLQVLAPAARGDGLPSGQITDIMCGRDGTVWAATVSGLAWSRDGGDSWQYERGIDWKDKLKGLLKPVQLPDAPNTALLYEDYISCLSEDAGGLIWVGFRSKGYEIHDPKTLKTLYASASDERAQFPYTSAILHLPAAQFGDAAPVTAFYGEGLRPSVKIPAPRVGEEPASTWEVPAPLPSALKPPTLSELNGLLKQLSAAKTDDATVVALDDDWTTQGDWLGRYGRGWAFLSALNAPHNYIWGASEHRVQWHAQIGPNSTTDDALRHWVHWLQTDNRRTLEMPPIYADSRLKLKFATPDKLRRQSELDDHGEEYPLWRDGPHLYFSLQIPPGTHQLSLYNFNKDGHDGMNRMRDYRLSLRVAKPNAPLREIGDFNQRPELAGARIRDFWGGVWKRFWVRGPQNLTIELNRNGSYNTILAGVFLDTWNETPAPYFRPSQVKSATGRDEKALQVLAGNFAAATEENRAADQLFEQIERLRFAAPAWWARQNRRFYFALSRHYAARRIESTPEQLPQVLARIATCAFWTRDFETWERLQRQLGLQSARDIEKSLQWDGVSSWPGRGREAVLRKVLGEKYPRSTSSVDVPAPVAEIGGEPKVSIKKN